MEVSKRIYKISNAIEYSTLADIGCDHCYLPVFAIQNGKVGSAVGIDVNRGPLEKAKENISQAGLSGKIELRLGYGLSPLKLGECESAVISGMGGMLICDIILKDIDIAKGFKQLILSPQSDVAYLRHALHKNGFCIYDEQMVLDKGKFYPIIMAKVGEDCQYSDFEYEYGKKNLLTPTEDFREFLKYSLKKNENIIESISNSSAGGDSYRKAMLEDENMLLRRWLEN